MPEWRNWQTRGIQNPVAARSCGFESHLRQSATVSVIERQPATVDVRTRHVRLRREISRPIDDEAQPAPSASLNATQHQSATDSVSQRPKSVRQFVRASRAMHVMDMSRVTRGGDRLMPGASVRSPQSPAATRVRSPTAGSRPSRAHPPVTDATAGDRRPPAAPPGTPQRSAQPRLR